jgi:hypothetical protein
MGEAPGTRRHNLVRWENHLQGIGGLTGAATIAVVAVSAILVGGCGSSSDSPSHLKLSVSESGKKASFTTPKSAEGGLVEVDLSNQGKVPHGVQFVRYTGDHTAEEALKQVSGESEETPDWLRAQGGIGAVQGGKSDTATLNLPEGNYVLIDAAAFSGGEGPPATAEMKINSGSEGSLPDTPATVVADETGKDKYAWDISGLKAASAAAFRAPCRRPRTSRRASASVRLIPGRSSISVLVRLIEAIRPSSSSAPLSRASISFLGSSGGASPSWTRVLAARRSRNSLSWL